MKSRLNNIYHPATLLALLLLLTASALRLAADNVYLKDYKLKHTRGIVDKELHGGNPKYENWVKDWGAAFDEEGEWKDSKGLSSLSTPIHIPSFTYEQYDPESRINRHIISGKGDYIIGEKGVRQKAHTTEHEIFVIPGEKALLYPFTDYGSSSTTGYMEKLNRWYDYTTDSTSNNLSFEGLYKDAIERGFGHLGGPGVAIEEELPGETVPIYTAEDLIRFAERVKKTKNDKGEEVYENNLNAELKANIDFSTYTGDFVMIGTSDRPYKGNFNGNGKTISNFNIDKAGEENVGLFAYVNSPAKISNLRIENASITGKKNVGLIGITQPGPDFKIHDKITIENVYIDAKFKSGDIAAGLIANVTKQYDLIISNCAVFGVFDCTLNDSGLFAGWVNSWALIASNCYGYATDKNNNPIVRVVNKWVNIIDKLDNCYIRVKNGKLKLVTTTKTYKDDGSVLTHKQDDYDAICSNDKPEYVLNSSDFIENALGIETWQILDGDAFPTPIYNRKQYLSRLAGAVALFHFENDDEDSKDEDGNTETAKYSGGMSSRNLKANKYIALDISQTFEASDKYLNEAEKVMIEPEVTFRHLFIVSDGRKLADEFSASEEKNKAYIEKHRRVVSAPVGKDFHVRFDHPVPTENVNSLSARYYYDQNESKYKRFTSVIVKAYDKNGKELRKRETIKKEQPKIDEEGNPQTDDDGNPIMEIVDVEVTSKASIFDLEAKTPGVGAGNAYDEFYRMIGCDKKFAIEGTYTVKIFAADGTGKAITVRSQSTNTPPTEPSETVGPEGDNATDTPPPYDAVKAEDTNEWLQVDEFIITFEPLKKAHVINEKIYDTEAEYKKGGVYYHTTRKYLDEIFPKPRAKVDFDEYRQLENYTMTDDENDFIKKYWNERESKYEVIYKSEGEIPHYAWNFGWPMEWSKSCYGFGYKDYGDYSMYMLANNSLGVPRHGATLMPKKDKGNWSEYENARYGHLYRKGDNFGKENGEYTLFDRLFYESGGEELGYFYYVNAATDPGIITRIDIDNLCPGAILYVSAWMSEFSTNFTNFADKNQGAGFSDETANIIINLQAIHENGSVTTVHSFVTGYVEDGYDRDDNGDVKENPKKMVDPNGKEVTVPMFDSNKTNDRGNWMHIYYSFVPDIIDIGNDVVGYQLVLENNAKTSNGADYAVDDIRIYMSHPNAISKQTTAYCNETYNTEVRMGIDFETLLATMGLINDPETLSADDDTEKTFYYTFVDKALYENYKAHSTASDKALAGSVLQYDYNCNGKDWFTKQKKDFKDSIAGGEGVIFGTVKFSPNKDKYKVKTGTENHIRYERVEDITEWYGPEGETSDKEKYNIPVLAENPDNHRDYLYFLTSPDDMEKKNMTAGREYYLVLYIPLKDETNKNYGYKDFKIDDNCAKLSEFTVEPSATIMLEGTALSSATEFVCCRNQQPEITVKLEFPSKDKDKEGEVVPKAYVDWFIGSMDDFCDEQYEYEIMGTDNQKTTVKLSVKDLLARFRRLNRYFPYEKGTDGNPNLEREIDWTQVKLEPSGNMAFTEDMKESLKNWSGNKLILLSAKHKFKYEDFKFDGEEKAALVISPIDIYDYMDEDINICMAPIEVTVKYVKPELNHGFAAIDYPKEINDVPIRLGLRQLFGEGSVSEYSPRLSVPLRFVETAKVNKWTDGSGKPSSEYVKLGEYLSENFDPDPDIYLYGINGETLENYSGTLPVVGSVEDWTAFEDEDKQDTNEIEIVFYNDVEYTDAQGENVNFVFEEGNEYTLLFKYSQYTEDGDYDRDLPPCGGEHRFTIKVVADYQMWTANEAPNVNNWNNDDNWRRIAYKELMSNPSAEATKMKDNDKPFVTDGSNTLEKSFSPLDFTKVIIPDKYNNEKVAAGIDMPSLHKPSVETSLIILGDGVKKWMWPENPSPKVAENSTATEEVFSPWTPGIQYDMVAECLPLHSEDTPKNELTDMENIKGLRCRPWYMNTCEQIHFMPDAEIGNQWLLDYRRAWVDVEIDENKWQLLASPLQDVVSGDWYAPTEMARQQTRLFDDITFEDDMNHRFAPAVYQRAWNKAKTYIYELGGGGNPENGTDKMLKTSWSHVYNDVEEENGAAGVGFSIKADTEKATGRMDNDKTVLFRLPKADAEYEYYTVDYAGEENKKGDKKSISRPNNYRLQEGFDSDGNLTTVVYAADYKSEGGTSNLFLVGNPFMAHLDMKAFFAANTNIRPKYWIMTSDSQNSAVMDEYSKGFVGTIDDAAIVAPMQGFFVEAIGTGSAPTIEIDGKEIGQRSLTLKFNKSMAKANVSSEKIGIRSTRSGDLDVMRIMAFDEDGSEFTAMIRMSNEAKAGYRADEDVEFFDDSDQSKMARVFTFADNMAVAINSLPEITTTEVGVLAPEGRRVTLVFDGVDAIGDAMLHDVADGSVTSIFDGMEYEVTGPVKNRLYITTGLDAEISSDMIKITSDGKEVTVTVPDSGEGFTADVYSIDGRRIASTSEEENHGSFTLPEGIYIVDVRSGYLKADRKVMIK